VEDLLDRLRLDTVARARGAVVVEGPTDADVFASSIPFGDLLFFPVGGRTNVLRAADQLVGAYLPGVVCVADSDFDDLTVTRADQWFLVFTDNADLEAMSYRSPALGRVLAVWGSATKLHDFGGPNALRAAIDDVVRPLSILRRESAARSIPIAFDALSLHDVVSTSGLKLNMAGVISRLATGSELARADIEALLTDESPICSYTGQLLTRGRDCLTVVDIALRKTIGSLSAQQVKDGLSRKSLFLAIREGDMAAAPFVERLGAALDRSLAA
jgi:hypothetical protein